MCKAVCFMPGKWSRAYTQRLLLITYRTFTCPIGCLDMWSRTYMSVTAEALSMTADEHCLVMLPGTYARGASLDTLENALRVLLPRC